ncbi:MAG: hypothetical protein PV358_09920 [Acidimicrobiales bacterium]|nr:hypothetical protein [Acidimicrobiales bacterium]
MSADHTTGAPEVRSRRGLVAAGVPLLAAVAVAAVVVTRRGGDGGSAGADPLTTVPVETRDLVINEEYTGELGFGESEPARAGRSGVVTGVSPVGSPVGQGGVLFHLDLEPTVLLHGEIPAFRDMTTEADPGADIAQLEQALIDLGFGDGVIADGDFTATTAEAVEAWEEALGRADPDGVAALGDILFAPGDLRIDAVTSDRGTQVQSGAEVVDVTATAKVVTLQLTVDEVGGIEAGTAVAIELPDGSAAGGVVADVASEPTAADAEAESADDGSGDETCAGGVTLDDPTGAAGFPSGGVDVAVESDRTADATAVPVTALLALAEGGYALQVADDSRPSGSVLVAVEVGTMADEWVQVTGDGIEPGVEVVVPA